MIPLLITGSLVAMSTLCWLLARTLRERDQARIALGIARMELLDVQCRLADTHRRVIELEKRADRVPSAAVMGGDGVAAANVANMANRMRTGHPMLGRSIPGGDQ